MEFMKLESSGSILPEPLYQNFMERECNFIEKVSGFRISKIQELRDSGSKN
jgi:hypothetical protein